MNALAKTEASELVSCEQVIERGRGTFIEVGNALLKIRDGKLYRASHKTFETYCKERWQMVPQHANRLIASSQVVAKLEPMGSVPQTERVARQIAKLPGTAQQEVWTEAVETAPKGKVTARHVERAIANRPQLTATAAKAAAEAEADSEKLWELKQAWKRAGKKDRAAFLKWTKQQPTA